MYTGMERIHICNIIVSSISTEDGLQSLRLGARCVWRRVGAAGRHARVSQSEAEIFLGKTTCRATKVSFHFSALGQFFPEHEY